MIKLIIVVLLIGLALYGAVNIYNDNNEAEQDIQVYYQGPVPIGYNLTHFRTTGETILNG